MAGQSFARRRERLEQDVDRRPPLAPALVPLRSVKLLDQVRERVRLLHYSRRTEQAYVQWCRAFIRFHHLQHPRDLGGPEVEAFLSWLADERQAAPATHRQALSALLFLYGKVLGQDLPWMREIGRPQTRPKLPIILTKDELSRVFCLLEGEHRLFARLLYGTGMRLSEGLQLRVKDVDFDHRAIFIREGKGRKDRTVAAVAGAAAARSTGALARAVAGGSGSRARRRLHA
jgi:integrase